MAIASTSAARESLMMSDELTLCTAVSHRPAHLFYLTPTDVCVERCVYVLVSERYCR
jgi:hypothetical protein